MNLKRTKIKNYLQYAQLIGNRAEIIHLFMLITAFILLTCGQWFAWNTPANGSEISIYVSTPIIFWIGYIFALILGLSIILRRIIRDDLPKKIYWCGVGLIAYCCISFITLFIVRGYFIYILLNGDVGAHYGIVSSILEFGNTTIHYPALHMFGAVIKIITGFSLDYTINITTVFMVIVFIIGANLVVRELISKLSARYLSFFIICLLPFGCSYYTMGSWSFSMFVPFLAGFCVSPFCLYFILKLFNNNDLNRNILILLLVVFLASVIFYHPVVYFVYMLLIAAIIAQNIIFSKLHQSLKSTAKSLLIALITSVVIFVLWCISLMGIANTSIRNIFWTMFGEKTFTSSSLGTTNTIIDSLFEFSFLGLIDIGLRYIGLLAMACFVLLIIFPNLLRNFRKSILSFKIGSFYLLAAIGTGYYCISLFVSLSIQSERLFPFIIFAGVLMLGILLASLLDNFKESSTPNHIRRVISITLFVCLITGCSILSVGLYYPSMTESLSPTSQNTHAFVEGNDFYLKHIVYEYPEIGAGVAYNRMCQAFYFSKPIIQKNNLLVTYSHTFKLLSNSILRYPQINMLGDYYDKNTYLSIFNPIKTYASISPILKYNQNLIKYNFIEFDHLEFDTSVNKYYDNPDLTIYQVI